MKRFIMTTALLMSAVVMLPAAAEAKGIKSISAARKKALREVKSAVVTEADIDYENGGIVYEIDLAKGNRDYTLIYRGSDGKLMEYEWDIENMEYNRQGKKNISKAQIKKKAKKKVKKAKITSAVLRYDDGLAEYKVLLKKKSKRYELVYSAKTGKLLGYEWKIAKFSTKSKYIGLAKAKSIARKKVPGAQFVKVEFDNDDGVPVYEIEMRSGRVEYDLTIHAKTGKILEYDQDIDD